MPTMTVFTEFQKTAEKVPANPFLHIPRQAREDDAHTALDYSYAQALDAINVLSQQYHTAGYGPGQRIAMVVDNRAEFFLHLHALNKLGVSIVPVNSGFLTEEMAYVIRHSDSCLVLSLPVHVEKVKQALARIETPVQIAETDSMETLPPSAAQVPGGEVGAETEAAVLYTSGTTAAPKGCMLNNDYFVSMGRWYVSIQGYCRLEYGQERMLTPLPLVHMNALCTMMAMIMTGGCIIQLDRFHASTWWETVRESRASCLHYLGVIPAILLNLPEQTNDYIGDLLKFGFGAGVDPEHLQRFENRFGFKLVEAWAMTETGTHVCITTHEESRHIGTPCIGKPFNPIEYRLVDEEGNDVQAGEPGELLIRAAGENPHKGFFSGYYKNAEETARVWDGGYFHTGDVLRVGEDGSFYFVDRRKNIIRRSGENIAAVEVENVLLQMPLVAHCAVTSVDDEIRGEEVAACIILRDGVTAGETTAAGIVDFCNTKLARYKVPAYFMFRSEIPLTASKKIQRGAIKELLAELVKQGKCIDMRELKRKT